jgi:hypothetical protein
MDSFSLVTATLSTRGAIVSPEMGESPCGVQRIGGRS